MIYLFIALPGLLLVAAAAYALHWRKRQLRRREVAEAEASRERARRESERKAAEVTLLPGMTMRRVLLGFQPLSIGAGLTACVQANPPRVFKPGALYIPDVIAYSFNVVQITVGTRVVFLTDNVPASCFSDLANPPEIDWPLVQVGESVTLTVCNISQQRLLFQARMVGKTIDG